MRDRRQCISDQNLFEANCIIAENEFQKLDKIIEYKTRVEPCRYIGYLIFGIFFTFMSINTVCHLFPHILLIFDGKTKYSYLDGLLQYIDSEPKATYVATFLFIFFGTYFLLCAQFGNIKVGLRFYQLQFYPITPR